MKAAACFLAALGVASAFVAPAVPVARKAAAAATTTPRMALNAELTKTYPRDFKNIPVGTSYGACDVRCRLRAAVGFGLIDRVGLVLDRCARASDQYMHLTDKPKHTHMAQARARTRC